MEVEIRDRPAFAHLHIRMNAGDRIVCEADAMASMSSTIEMSTRLNGGLIGGVAKRVLGSESLFINEFTTATEGDLVATQSLPGDIECLELKGETFYLQPGAFIASDPTVTLGVGWAGVSSFIGGEGLLRLKVSGTGRVWFGAYGSIYAREIKDEYVVDTGHLVGYEPSIHLKVGMAGGLFSSFFSGEGLVTRVRGPGKVYLQTRSLGGLVAWTNSFLG